MGNFSESNQRITDMKHAGLNTLRFQHNFSFKRSRTLTFVLIFFRNMIKFAFVNSNFVIDSVKM